MKTFFVLLIVLLSGCASGPVATSHADNAPSSQILTQRWLSPSPGTGSLTVKRDGGLVRAACRIRVYIDHTAVADLAPAEKVEVFLPVGDHKVEATTRGICPGGTSEITMEISAALKRVVRIVAGRSQGIELRSTAF